MNPNRTASLVYGALVFVVSLWVLHSFLLPVLVACVTAIASWPLYEQFRARLPKRAGRGTASLLFTVLITVFVLAPMAFAVGALLTEARTVLLEIAAADGHGIPAPDWLRKLPFEAGWLAERWQSTLAHPGALASWAERAGPAALLGWAQSLGQFMARQALVIGFAVLLLFFLYQEGESLAAGLRRILRRHVGERSEAHVEVAVRAVRASVNSMLIVGLFDGVAAGAAYHLASAPHAALWAMITGALALVPFLGYAAVAALALELAMTGATGGAIVTLTLGSIVLLCGDKIVRPVVARDGTRLPFVWVLMGCLGGFEVFGLIGVVIGPVALALAREVLTER